MSADLSASRTFYSQLHAYSNAFTSGWIRDSTITTTRSVRDIDDDKSRLFTEIIRLPIENSNEKGLISIKGNNFEVVKPVFQDISPSGIYLYSYLYTYTFIYIHIYIYIHAYIINIYIYAYFNFRQFHIIIKSIW
jgi:hypothetical protein